MLKHVLALFAFLMVSLASVYADELDFSSFLDPSNPRLSENPASITQLTDVYFDTKMPITYSNSNVIRQKIYYRDFYCESYEAQFKKENTMIIEGKLATKNYGITYKKNISKFEDVLKNTNQLLNINKEIYDEESNGFVIGNYFGPFLFGVHQERIKINSRIKTSLNSEINGCC